LSVTDLKDKMYITVLKPAEAAPNDELYLLAHTRGMVHFVDRWNPDKKYIIYPEQFPSGVLDLILFDASLNPISERLVFINNKDQTEVSYKPDQESYTARSLVKNRILLNDSDGQPIVANFSVAVTSDREVQTDSLSNILTQLLLTSDLRGNIENPAFYFQNTTSSELALDLLMCTQGWRRYNIAELTHGRFAKPTIPIETIPEISGIVKNDLGGAPAKNMEVIILSVKNDYFDQTKTDKDGRFSFHGIEWPDSTSFTVSVKMKKTTTAKDLIIDREIFPKKTLPALPYAAIDRNQLAEYVEKADRQYVIENGIRMIHLPEVRIVAEKKQPSYSLFYDPSNNAGAEIITAEKIRQLGGKTNIASVLNQIPGVSVMSDGQFVTSISIRNNGFHEPLLMLDDMAIGSINDIDINSIEQIDVFKGANPWGMRSGSGVIVFHTKPGGIVTDNTKYLHIKQILPLGYQQPVEFYSPKYDTPEKLNRQTPDFRTTIYWQPIVQTDEQGEASFEFYTADESTSYTVVIEGLANDGSIIYKEGKLLIQSRN